MNAGPPDDPEFREILEAQRAEYRKACRAKFEALRDAWERVGTGRADAGALKDLQRLVHTFAGSGPTFGFEALGAAARDLERALARLAATPATSTLVQRSQIESAILALERALPDPE
jgi:HPt (histidine-containing phosphotransfer) domain-containing protein